MASVLMRHDDVITVPEVIKSLMKSYVKDGYIVEKVSPMSFKIVLDDGDLYFWWEKGVVYYDTLNQL